MFRARIRYKHVTLGLEFTVSYYVIECVSPRVVQSSDLCSENLSVVLRGIGFISCQTRRNATTSTIAEANIDITRSIFVPSRQRSTTYRLKRSSNVALYPCGSSRLQERGFVYNVLLFCTSNQAQRSNNVHDVF